MTETNNLKLKKFEGTDNFDYTKLNQNADVLDGVVSNPNLLDNPWFTVNQRGFTSDYAKNGGYTVDRWKKDAKSNLVCSDDGISFSTTDNGHLVSQILDGNVIPFLYGKVVTLSVMLKDSTIISDFGTFPSSSVSSTTSVARCDINDDYVFEFVVDSTARVRIRKVSSGATDVPIYIRAVKLEYGSVSTLANDHAPDYATELLKCQRYFQKIYRRILAYSINSSTIIFEVPMYVEMRVAPSVVGTPNISANGGSSLSGFSITYQYIESYRFRVDAVKSSHGYSFSNNMTMQGVFSLSADL